MKPGHSGGPTQEPRQIQDCLSDFYLGLSDHRPIGIAVSGGSDSLGLLYGLAGLLPQRKLVALTVDHGLRPASADEARWVKARCRRLGIRHETLRWESGQPASGLQAAARAARYRLLGEASARLGLAAILTAHTREDQNETLAMRRARGPSNDAPGMAGISPATLFEGRMWVLRPLLGLDRETIRAFLRSKGVHAWVEDPSNSDTRFERVRVRTQARDEAAPIVELQAPQIAMRRYQLACEAAALIDASCEVDVNGLVRMQCDEKTSGDVLTAAVEALIDVQGAASRPLDRRGKATLADFLSSIASNGSVSTISLGRSLVRHRGSSLTIGRERRDIGELVLEPGQCGVWDRRFRIGNLCSRSALLVRGGGAGGVQPFLSRDPDDPASERHMSEGVIGGFVCQPLLGSCSRILPVHRLPLAQALARLTGHKQLPACPWGKPMDIAALTAMTLR